MPKLKYMGNMNNEMERRLHRNCVPERSIGKLALVSYEWKERHLPVTLVLETEETIEARELGHAGKGACAGACLTRTLHGAAKYKDNGEEA
jgi:hypothetical protein